METLQNIWNTYKGDVIPAIVTGMLIILSALFIYIASKIKTKGYKEEAKAKADSERDEHLRKSNDDISSVKITVEQLNTVVNTVKDSMFYLGELINSAFQDSSLSPEKKEALNNILLRIKNGVGEDTINELNKEVIKYKELYESAENKIKETVDKVADITKAKGNRIRR